MLLALCAGAIGMLASSSFAEGPAAPKPIPLNGVVTQDTNGDGYLDAVLITFDSPMTQTANVSGFSVERHPGLGTEWRSATQLLVKLLADTSNPLGNTALTPKVTYTSGSANPPKSLAGFEVNGGQNAEYESTDSAGPVLMQVLAKDIQTVNTFNEAGDEMAFVFSENIKVNGATPTDQVKSLDLAFKFSVITTCGGQSVVDGNATNNQSNFPAVSGPNNATNPIVEPVAGTDSNVIRVRKHGDAGDSQLKNLAAGGMCGVGIDGANGAGITDLVEPTPNNAVSQDLGGAFRHRRPIVAAPSDLAVIDGKTQIYSGDFAPGSGDGYVDSVRVIYQHALKDSTITNDLASKFTVSGLGSSATVVGVDTGTAENDGSLTVRLSGVTWGGGVKPTVSFDGGACTLKTLVPTPEHTACAASFGLPTAIESLDGVGPAYVSSVALDQNGNGMVERIEVTLTEPAAATTTKDGWTVAGQPADSLSVSGTKLLIGIVEVAAVGTGDDISVSYSQAGNTTDADGAELNAQTFTPADGASPRVTKATLLSSTNNGNIDRVTLEFSEKVIDASFDASLFSVGGTTPAGFSTSALDTGVSDDNKVTLAVNVPGTAKVAVDYTGELADAASNKTTGFNLAAAEVIDKAAPAVISLTTNPTSPYGISTVTVSVQFSEAVDGNVAPVVKLGEKTVAPVTTGDHNANGFQNADLSKWDGTVDIVAADCNEHSGCASSITATGAKDGSANDGIAATPLSVVYDTVAPSAATGVNTVSLQETGQAAIADNTVGGHSKNLRVTAGITAGQITAIGQTAGGFAEILVDGNALTPAARLAGIAGDASSVTVETAFADSAALRSAISEGAHQVAVKLCDSAGNCSTSESTALTADYTPVGATLINPNQGSFIGGENVCIRWDGADGADFQSLSLRYKDGTKAPVVIASDLARDGLGDCAAAEGAGFNWTVPKLNTSALRVQVVTLDSFGNTGIAQSAFDLTVETITPTVLNLTSNVTGVVYGQVATLAGSLKGYEPLAARKVAIERKFATQSAFSKIAELTTDANGAFRYAFKPGATAEYRAVFAKAGPYLGSISAVKRITTAVNVTSTTNGTKFGRGQTFTIRGSVLPAHTGKWVQFQALLGGQWKTIASQKLGTNNVYNFTYRSTVARKLLFRVAYSTQDADHAWNISQRYFVTWS